MIELNVVQVYLEQNIMNIPVQYEGVFPNDGMNVWVVCGDFTFMGVGNREHAGGGVRLTFLLLCDTPGDNRSYNEFMGGRGVGSTLQFEVIMDPNNRVAGLNLIN